ncbi:hypothetical protein BASA60_008389 [Batrachochytrium salamandrivorans]|nr:hypothetical protein BASA60_008389 [Batrachochytrium salamandrivorans]KAH9245766.1 hypothetical protein BASA81_016731 [Batrachochytrium salamandrivorans]KAH9276159.1 hypothetical protein BASA83_001433 [Batrachochytrium salamandrivorans]
MKLAIASTTLLFAMMAAQATVLSVAPVTGVNLVKRAPNGGEDDEQSAMVDPFSSGLTFQDPLTEKEEERMDDLYDALRRKLGDSTRLYYSIPEDISEYEELIKDLKKACKGEDSPACTKVGAVVAELEEKVVNLEEKFKTNQKEYLTKLDEEMVLKEAMRLEDHDYLRAYLNSQ